MTRFSDNRHSTKRLTGNRLFAASATALMGTLVVAAGSAPVSSSATAAEVPTLGTSMVDMLDGESTNGVVSLAELRNDTLGSWSASDGGGVDVALIDTGVAPVPGLDGQDKVLHGPDLSMEASTPEVAFLDTYGHGTHLAGIIAGDRAGHEGIAPGARIISLKVAGHDGATTVPQVVAAIDWVVEHRNSDGLNIRVLNLSLGQEGVSDHVGDVLSAAVERAWHAGIVVVVAGGNDGDVQSHLDSPAIDPYVLAVGAVDSTGSAQPGYRDVPVWSANGEDSRDPDIVAPGLSIASYRVPGSTADTTWPTAREGDDLFRGSGTSQAAAVTSGVVAVLISDQPELTPDEVKATIRKRAFEVHHVEDTREGKGHIDGFDTVSDEPVTWKSPQSHTAAVGGSTGIVSPSGATWTGGSWSGASWSGASWSGAAWSGGTWSGASWSGASWSGASWSGASWSGASWSGASWSGASWSGASWSGASWSGNGWA